MRLVTLTGAGRYRQDPPGSAGAADLLDDFEDGVWFVELAALTEPNLMIPTIAAALGVREAAVALPSSRR